MTVNLENNAQGTTKNTIYVNKTMTVNPSATINITLTGTAGERRGINTDNADVVIDGGTVVVKSEYSGTDATYGIRGANVTVKDGGTLDVEGTTNGVASRSGKGTLTVLGKSLVTFNTTGGQYADSNETQNTITGSSVKMQDAYSIVNGQKTTVDTDKVAPTPVNAAGEELTRFDLKGMANKSIEIAADPANTTGHPAYTYAVGADHNGTAYVWAPAVKVTFWSNASKAVQIQQNETIRGKSIEFVGGSTPDAAASKLAPTGTRFLYWVNAATGKKFDPAADTVDTDTDVYAVYSGVVSKTIPIDVLEDNGDAKTMVNGPRYAAVGDQVHYQMTIDLSDIAKIAATYGTSTGYLSGTYTMTVSLGDGLTLSSETVKALTDNIDDYFTGDAVKLFELTGKPVYNSTANTFTVTAKVKDDYAKTGIAADELAALLKAGLYAESKNCNVAVVTDAVKTPGYARAKITFTGDINYCNTSYTEDYTIDMTGVQKTPETTYKDPTLASYGKDPADTVSATVLYKSNETPVTPVYTFYNVKYSYVSGTTGTALPAEVTALLPTASQVVNGTTVTPAQPAKTTVAVTGGTWTFAGYDAASKTVNGADVVFTGTWTYKAGTTDIGTQPTPGSGTTDIGTQPTPGAGTTGTGTSSHTGSGTHTAPQTDDNSPIFLYLFLLALSACLICVFRKHASSEE